MVLLAWLACPDPHASDEGALAELEALDSVVDTGPCGEVLEGEGIGGCDGPPCGTTDGGGSGPGEPVVVGSGACGGGGRATAVLVGLLAVWLGRRRALALLLLLAPAAHAVNVEHLDYGTGGAYASFQDPDLGDPWSARAALAVSWARNPAVLRYPDQRVEPILAQLVTARLGAATHLGPIQLGVSVPFHPVLVDGAGRTFLFGPGDVGFGVAAQVIPERVAVTVDGWVPTGWEGMFVGADRPEGKLAVAGGAPLGKIFDAAAQAGVRVRRPEQLPGAKWGTTLAYGAGLGAELVRWRFTAELFGQVALVESPVEALRPTEVLLTARAPLGVRFGVGAGLGDGLGNPLPRLMVAVDRVRPARDTDGDGYVDLRDVCDRKPEDRDHVRDFDGCPEADNDRDGIEDPVDGCPNEPEVLNAWLDEDGCPDARATVSFVVPGNAPTPEVVELTVDGVSVGRLFPEEPATLVLDPTTHRILAEADGFLPLELTYVAPPGPSRVMLDLAPVPEGALVVHATNALGEVVDAEVHVRGVIVVPHEGVTRIALVPGPVEAEVVAEGWLPVTITAEIPEIGEVHATVVLARPAIAWVDGQLLLDDRIGFALDEAIPGPPEALDRLAAWLLAHPEIRLLRIEGHADAIGTPAYNHDLSLRRAEAVRRALVERQVPAERLEAIGTGEATRTTDGPPERMVEFLVLIWDPVPYDEP